MKLIELRDYLEATNEFDDTIYTYVLVEDDDLRPLVNDLEAVIRRHHDNDGLNENLYDILMKTINSHNAHVVKPEVINY